MSNKALKVLQNSYLHTRQKKCNICVKLFTLLNETGAQAIISAIEAPSHEYKSLKEVIEITYEHEKLITSKINELVGKTF